MSLNAVFHPHRTPVQDQAISDPRLHAHGGESNSLLSNAEKIAVIAISVIVSIGSFILAGPVVGFAVTLMSGIVSTFLLFPSCCEDCPEPSSWSMEPTPPHVIVGGGHFPQPSTRGGRGSYPPVTVLSSPSRGTPVRSEPGRHVSVGGGHTLPPVSTSESNLRTGAPAFRRDGGTTPLSAPSGPGGHVEVGGGHTPIPGRTASERASYPSASVSHSSSEATTTPALSGPTGHVGVGGGHAASLRRAPSERASYPSTPVTAMPDLRHSSGTTSLPAPSGPSRHVSVGGGHQPDVLREPSGIPPASDLPGSSSLPPPLSPSLHVHVGSGHQPETDTPPGSSGGHVSVGSRRRS